MAQQDQSLLSLPQLHMFDIGKRERKPTQSNLNEGALLKRMTNDGDGRCVRAFLSCFRGWMERRNVFFFVVTIYGW